MTEPIKGYKGFDKKMKCRDFQYQVGEEYTESGEIKACKKGFHFCEHPLDVFNYYAPSESQFAEVIGKGNLSKEKDGDSKIACSVIQITAKISLSKLIKAAVDFTFKKIKWDDKSSSSGDYSGASSSGNYSGASSSGNCSGASSSGDYSTAEAGKGCVAMVVGYECKAKGKIGSWLVLSEAEKIDGTTFIKDVRSVKVDGADIEEDVFYCLKNGVIQKSK